MIVKIGNRIFDSSEEGIVLVLSDDEKKAISLMGEQNTFCSYPTDWTEKQAYSFMKIPEHPPICFASRLEQASDVNLVVYKGSNREEAENIYSEYKAAKLKDKAVTIFPNMEVDIYVSSVSFYDPKAGGLDGCDEKNYVVSVVGNVI